MSKNYASYRELIADALSPKPSTRANGGAQADGEVMIATGLRFKPSSQSLQKADEIRKRFARS